MIKKLSGASIWSQDLNGLLPFYRDVLGLKVTNGSADSGFVVLGGGDGGAFLGLGTHSQVKGPTSDPHRHMVGLDVDDLDAEHRRLSAAGVEFVETPTDYGDLRIATLKDPEGNLIQLFQPTS